MILGLAFLCLLGLVARYVQRRAQPLPDVDYAGVEWAFEQASAAPSADSLVQAHAVAKPGDSSGAGQAAYLPKAALSAGAIDLNGATAATLQRLPRIGPKTAARIIAYREAHGPFRRVQDLVQVRGIGKKTLAQLEPYLVVEEQGSK